MQKTNRGTVQKIKKILEERPRPLIILISGINSSGKTTLAFEIGKILDIKQRVGLGSIVKTLIVAANKKDRNLFEKMDNDFSSFQDLKEIKHQSKIICKPVNLLIKSYYEGGVSCIIEGVQLLPEYLSENKGKFLHFHLTISDHKKFKQQLESSKTRSPRKLDSESSESLLKKEAYLTNKMKGGDVFYIQNNSSVTESVNKILNTILESYL